MDTQTRSAEQRSPEELPGRRARVPSHLVFLPRVQLASGNLAGFETLLRRGATPGDAVTPDGSAAAPGEQGLTGQDTHWMLDQAVTQLRRWEDLGHCGLQLSIRLDDGALEDTGTDGFLLDLLRRHQIAGNQIELALTERSFTSAHPNLIARLQALREHSGVCIAIHDFGAGCSSLGQLARMPLDCLKLDPNVVSDALSSPAAAMVCRMTGELARTMKLRLVVNGLRTEGQARFFCDLHCDLAQGPLFAEACSALEATALLHSKRVFARVAQSNQPARHLLLLDDEPNILRSLRRVFRAAGHVLHTAETPDEAFELLARHPVGVVISDQRMPLMRGTDFLARVKTLYPDTVRIVLSGYTELQSVTEAINQGAIFKFLTKPWNDVLLNEEIELAFKQHERVAERQRLQEQLRKSNLQLEARLQKNEERLQRGEVALDVSHEALGVVPVPILGIDVSGMIALSNAAAEQLLGGGASMVGQHVGDVLPPDLIVCIDQPADVGVQTVKIGAVQYDLIRSELGANSRGTGTVITLLRGAQRDH